MEERDAPSNSGAFGLSGSHLQAARKALGLNQTEFGRSIGLSRHTISYWETKTRITSDQYHGTVQRMCSALGLPYFARPKARAGEWGFTRTQKTVSGQQFETELDPARKKRRASNTKPPIVCGAKTRRGNPCRLKAEPGKLRCKFHGGKSTGPRTQEGRKRISEAQRRRWANFKREIPKQTII